MSIRFFAFLRAINVGGHTVKMDALCSMVESLGFSNVETFIASGNVIFTAATKDAAALEQRIESKLKKELGYEVATFLRTDTELAAIVKYQPFPKSRLSTAGSFTVGFLAAPLDSAAKQALMSLKTVIDDFHVHGREFYWLCLKRQSESTFSNVLFEKRTGMRSTLRGMNTVLKLAQRYSVGG